MLGHVPYDHAFDALTAGCAPYDRAFSVLIVRSLSITKKEKLALTEIALTISDLRARCTTNTAHWTFNTRRKKCSIYYQLCLGCGFAGMLVKFRQELSTLRHSKHCGQGNDRGQNLSKMNSMFLKNWRFISRKFDVNPC